MTVRLYRPPLCAVAVTHRHDKVSANAGGQRRQRAPFMSAEHRAAIAEAVRRKWQDPEYRAKVKFFAAVKLRSTIELRCSAQSHITAT